MLHFVRADMFDWVGFMQSDRVSGQIRPLLLVVLNS